MATCSYDKEMDTLATTLKRPNPSKEVDFFLFHLRLIFMIDDKVLPLSCIWGQSVFGASVQSVKEKLF